MQIAPTVTEQSSDSGILNLGQVFERYLSTEISLYEYIDLLTMPEVSTKASNLCAIQAEPSGYETPTSILHRKVFRKYADGELSVDKYIEFLRAIEKPSDLLKYATTTLLQKKLKSSYSYYQSRNHPLLDLSKDIIEIALLSLSTKEIFEALSNLQITRSGKNGKLLVKKAALHVQNALIIALLSSGVYISSITIYTWLGCVSMMMGFTINDAYQSVTLYYPPDLEIKTIEPLLHAGLRPGLLLKAAVAMGNEWSDKQKEQFIDLAFLYKLHPLAIWDVIARLKAEFTSTLLGRLLDHGFDANRALKFVLNIVEHKNGEFLTNIITQNQREFLGVVLEKGGDINEFLNSKKDVDNYYEQLSIIRMSDVLLEHPIRPLLPDKLLEIIFLVQTLLPELSHLDRTMLNSGMLKALAKGANMNMVLNKGYRPVLLFLNDNKEIFVQYSGPSRLLYLSLLSDEEEYNDDLALELATYAIDHGADVNVNYNGQVPLQLAEKLAHNSGYNSRVVELLKSSGATCSNLLFVQLKEAGLERIFAKPDWSIQQKYKNLKARPSKEPKMPYTLHNIWLTSPKNPREIRDQDMAIALNNIKIFAQATVSWRHILWTNNKSLIPKSVEQLEKAGINVLSIYEYKANWRLFNLIETLIEKEDWGRASDTLRQSIVWREGGVYADINFGFYRHVTSEVHTFNFFTKGAPCGGIFLENQFFGASPRHPIVDSTLLLIERNILTPPKYIDDIQNKSTSQVVYLSTANPIFLGYYLRAHENGNVDIVYPSPQNTKWVLPKTVSCVGDEPMRDLEAYIELNDICGNSGFYIGQDSTNGNTWLS